MLMKAAAKVVCDVVFPVRKRSGAAESAHDRTGFASHACFHFIAVDRAPALIQFPSKLKNSCFQRFLRFFRKFVGSEDAPGSRSDDQYIVIHLYTGLSVRFTGSSCRPVDYIIEG